MNNKRRRKQLKKKRQKELLRKEKGLGSIHGKPKLETIKFLSRYLVRGEDNLKRLIDGINDLKKKYGLKYKIHKDHPDVIQINYDPNTSDFSQTIVKECRNLIISIKDAHIYVVSLGFYKFFNYGDPRSHYFQATETKNKKNKEKVDFFDLKNEATDIRVLEKLDGSIIVLYYHKGKWEVSSNNCPDGNGSITFEETKDNEKITKSLTIRELFWEIWKKLDYQLPKDTTKSYIFELITPKLLQIVQYTQERIVLIGCRNMSTLSELGNDCRISEISKLNGWEVVQEYSPESSKFESFEQVIAETKKFSPFQNEGFVVTYKTPNDDLNFGRIKVKTPQHVFISNLKNFKGWEREEQFLFNLILRNEYSEFLLYFPQYKTHFQLVKKEFDNWKIFFFNLLMKNENFTNKSLIAIKKYLKEARNSIEKDDWNPNTMFEAIKKNYPFKEIFRFFKTFNYFVIKLTESLTQRLKSLQNEDFKSGQNKLKQIFQNLKKEIKRKFPKSRLVVYGSNLYGMTLNNSDLDVCLLNFGGNGSNLHQFQKDLKVLMKTLNQMKFQRVTFLEYRNLIKFETGTKGSPNFCKIDLILNSEKNIKKSETIKQISSVTSVFGDLLVLIKKVLKEHYNFTKYNKDCYLNSFSITLLLVFFLQQEKVLPKKLNFKKRDLKKLKKKAFLGELFYKFFAYFENFKFDSEDKNGNEEKQIDVGNYCFSVRTGELIRIEDSKLTKSKDSAFYIEDFLEPTENTARTINKKTVKKLGIVFNEIKTKLENANCDELFSENAE